MLPMKSTLLTQLQPADNNSNFSSDEISDVTSHSNTLIDNSSPAQILNNCMQLLHI